MSSSSELLRKARSQYTLGMSLFNQGKGTHAQIVSAMIAWRSAADAGMPEAMYALGVASASASQNDAAAAFQWFMRGAENAHAKSMFNLAGETRPIQNSSTNRATSTRLSLLFTWHGRRDGLLLSDPVVSSRP